MLDGAPSSTPESISATTGGSGSRSATLVPAAELARTLTPRTAPNGIRYASAGETRVTREDLERVLHAVPASVAHALSGRVFYFVPLALPEARRGEPAEGDAHAGHTLIATEYDAELSDEAICHRNCSLPGTANTPAHEGVFLSARLLRDQFSLAFEFFINVGHAFAAAVGVPQEFEELLWVQVRAGVRGETSQDAWESRKDALGVGASERVAASERVGASDHDSARSGVAPHALDERARGEFLLTALADALAIYLLSLAVDFDYAELREREYPLLAATALAERLRLVAKLFPPNPGYEFSIRYRRR